MAPWALLRRFFLVMLVVSGGVMVHQLWVTSILEGDIHPSPPPDDTNRAAIPKAPDTSGVVNTSNLLKDTPPSPSSSAKGSLSSEDTSEPAFSSNYHCLCDTYTSYMAAAADLAPLHFATRCDAMTDAWRQRLEKYIHLHEESRRRDPRKTKFLVASAEGGMGNRILSLVSSFLLAVMTDRVFVIHQETEGRIRNLFARPCFEWLISDYQKTMKGRYDLVASAPCKIYIPIGSNGRMERIRRLKCMDPHTAFNNCPVLFVHSHQYYVPLLFANPFLGNSLRKLFPEDVFRPVRGVLFRPREEILRSVRASLQQLPLNPSQALGIQLRARMLKESHNVSSSPRIASFVQCIQRLLREKHLSHVFVATDRLEVRTLLSSSLGADHMRFFPTEEDRLDKQRKLTDERHALVEMLLVALCVERATTLKSTYGTVLRSFAPNLSFDGEQCTLYDNYEAEFQLSSIMEKLPCTQH